MSAAVAAGRLALWRPSFGGGHVYLARPRFGNPLHESLDPSEARLFRSETDAQFFRDSLRTEDELAEFDGRGYRLAAAAVSMTLTDNPLPLP